MTLSLVRNELNRFLSEPNAEVLALRGKWGAGKTYCWNRILEDVNKSNSISRKRYAYLSLFGIRSLDEMRLSLFEQSIDCKLIGKEPSLATFKKNAAMLSESLGRKAWRIVSSTSLIKPATPALEAMAFFSIRNTLICLDDLERRSDSLSIRDILGLVSLLKEQRNCKLVLLLNDGEDGLDQYAKHREKVVDIELHFAPTAKECSEIVFAEAEDLYRSIGEQSQKLNITNIRTLKKIERLVRLVEPRLKDLDSILADQIVHTLVLYGWCHFQAGDPDVPSLDYVQNIQYASVGLNEKNQFPNHELSWNAKLREYGYSVTDELDMVLARLVTSGFLNDADFDKAAKKKGAKISATKANESFREAWRTYHDNFTSDQNTVISTIYESFKVNLKYITPLNLNGTVLLFRELKENEKADELIDLYVNSRSDEPELLKLRDYSFSSEINDKKLRDCFEKAYKKTAIIETPVEILKRIARSNYWNDMDLKILADLAPDEYYKLFKSESGEHLSLIVETCIGFAHLSDPNDSQRQISENAKNALVRIAKESAINALRVRKFGIKLNDETE